MEESDVEKALLSNPKVAEYNPLLREIGILDYLDSLKRDIHEYRELVVSALDIFNHTSVDEIIDATALHISGHFHPDFVSFFWKPIQSKADITVKSYQNCKPISLKLNIKNIIALENYFTLSPKPVHYREFREKLEDREEIKTLEELKPEFFIPILGLRGLYGLIIIGRKMADEDYTSMELSFLEYLISFVSQAIQNHLHYEQTLRDFKTGLFNHSYFIHRLGEEFARVKRSRISSSIIVIDVDKFKIFNDTYGHLAGDKVLESLSLTIKQAVRTEDVPSRFGGEEFTVLLPDTNAETAFIVAERLRNGVAEMEVPWDPPLPRVTISLGVYCFNKESVSTAEQILLRADEALYLSKKNGRNQTTLWEDHCSEPRGKKGVHKPGLKETS